MVDTSEGGFCRVGEMLRGEVEGEAEEKDDYGVEGEMRQASVERIGRRG